MFHLDTKKKKRNFNNYIFKTFFPAKNRDVSYRKKFTGGNLIGLVCKCVREGKGGGLWHGAPTETRSSYTLPLDISVCNWLLFKRRRTSTLFSHVGMEQTLPGITFCSLKCLAR